MSSSGKGGGINILGVLAVLFIALKLTGYITWSWFWVLSPIILPLMFVVSIFMVYLLLLVVVGQ